MTQISRETEPLYSSFGDDPELEEILEMFVEEMSDRVAALLDRLHASDWEGLRRAAHQLKGAAGSYGFAPISLCAARVENAVRQGAPEEQIRDAVDELVNICKRARSGTPA